MKFKIMLIGIALALTLCISPVVAVSGDDFEVVEEIGQYSGKHTYFNRAGPNETYIVIFAQGTDWLNSIVTFKPANIPDAPVMAVNTTMLPGIKTIIGHELIYLPRSVDEWEIKYYSYWSYMSSPDSKYLKNAGVVNLNEFFGDSISEWLYLELSCNQFISPQNYPYNEDGYIGKPVWFIPEVKK